MLTPVCDHWLMGSSGNGRASSLLASLISLGLLAWGLYLIGYGWDMLDSLNAHWREGGRTFVAGGILFLVLALAGIVQASMKLRALSKPGSNRR